MSQYQNELDTNGKDPVQNDEKEGNKEHKPDDIVFSDTIINPRTMMIVLFYACIANIAMIRPTRLILDTSKAK